MIKQVERSYKSAKSFQTERPLNVSNHRFCLTQKSCQHTVFPPHLWPVYSDTGINIFASVKYKSKVTIILPLSYYTASIMASPIPPLKRFNLLSPFHAAKRAYIDQLLLSLMHRTRRLTEKASTDENYPLGEPSTSRIVIPGSAWTTKIRSRTIPDIPGVFALMLSDSRC